jgi:hypothetical protein
MLRHYDTDGCGVRNSPRMGGDGVRGGAAVRLHAAAISTATAERERQRDYGHRRLGCQE